MKPEQQRMAIAESAGLTKYGPLVRMTRKGKPDLNGVRICYHVASKGGWTEYAEIPDYLSNRNAIIEARKSMTNEQRVAMIIELYKICDREYSSSEVSWSDVVSDPVEINSTLSDAPNEWWAEAYLRTLNLWTD